MSVISVVVGVVDAAKILNQCQEDHIQSLKIYYSDCLQQTILYHFNGK